MNTGKITVLTLVLGAFLTAACSVKEDRMQCPCFLTEDFSRVELPVEGSVPWISLLDDTGRAVAQHPIHPDMMRSGPSYVARVPKDDIGVAVLYGSVHYSVSSRPDVLELASGFEADSLYGHCARVDCRRETASDTVRLYKQWCTLELKLEGSESWKPYYFEIHGNWSGINLRDFSAAPGPLCCIPRKTGPVTFEVRLPRQGDASLSLQVYETDGFGMPSELRYEYPLGKLLEHRGYDWKRKGLDDALVTIDYAKADVQVEIAPWDDGQDYHDITI